MDQPPVRTLFPADARRVAQARLIRGMAGVSQALCLVALYVLWKPFHVPFWTAVEWCVVSGVAVYTVLGAIATVLLVWARLEPFALLAFHATRIASVGVFAALRYVQGLGLIRSALVFSGMYLVAAMMVRRIEKRFRSRLPV
jgi:hypothetical protein